MMAVDFGSIGDILSDFDLKLLKKVLEREMGGSSGFGNFGDSSGFGNVGDSSRARNRFLCVFQNACNVIAHIIKYRREYEKAIKSVQKAREAREFGGLYCLNFCDPCTGKNITMKGNRILFIVNNPYCRKFCSLTEEALAKVLIYRNFFREVYYSITLAYRARTSVKEFCKTFVVPESLFTIIGTRSATLTGKQLLNPSCLGNGLFITLPDVTTLSEFGGGNFNPDVNPDVNPDDSMQNLEGAMQNP